MKILSRGTKLLTAFAALSGYCLFLSWMAACSKPLTASELRGKDLYTFHCSECHDESQPELKKAPPKLNRLFTSGKLPDGVTPTTEAALRNIIIYGECTMPAFDGRLNDQQVADLIAYLHRKTN